MKGLYVSYPRYDTDMMCYGYYVYLHVVFTHNKKSYLITKATNKRQLARNMRLLHSLKNKDSILYSELLLAISKFNSGGCNYTSSKKVSKKILGAAGIKRHKHCRPTIYSDGFYYDSYDRNILLLNFVNERLPIISTDFEFSCVDSCNSIY